MAKWLIDTGYIEKVKEGRQGSQLSGDHNSPVRANESLIGGNGKKKADTRATMQVELTSLLNLPWLPIARETIENCLLTSLIYFSGLTHLL